MKKNAGRSDSAVSPKSSGQSRRTALRRLLAGGTLAGAAAALPSRWTQPIVQSVLLPAHAQISGEPDGDFFPSFVGMSTYNGRPGEYAIDKVRPSGWLESLVPSAHAGSEIGGECFTCNICARIRNGQITVTMLLTPPLTNTFIACFEASGAIGDTINPSFVSGNDELECDPAFVSIVSLDGQQPNRSLVVEVGSDELTLVENTNRTCSCGELDDEGCVFIANCVLHGTPVLLTDGRSRSIETLLVGDIVAAVDHGRGGVKPAVVTRIVTNHLRDHYWRINDSLLITNDHPVLVVDEAGPAWRRVDALAVGMAIQGVHGRTVITSLERVDEHVPTVYMETTADSFIAAPNGVEYVVKAGYGAAESRNSREESVMVSA